MAKATNKEVAAKATKVENANLSNINVKALYEELIACTTKKALVDTMNKHGLRCTTLPTTTPNINDLYIQFIDKSRIQFSKKVMKLWTAEQVVKDLELTYDQVNDGSYRKCRATMPKAVEGFEKILNYMLQNPDNYLAK